MSQSTDHTTGLSEQQFAAILQREAAATPGPWVLNDDFAEIKAPASHDTIADYWEPTHASRNGEFIANAREDIPVLLAEVERLTALVADMHAAATGHTNGPLLGYVEDMRGVRDAVNAQMHRADTLNRLAREHRAAADRLRGDARTAATLLRSTVDRVTSGQPVDARTLAEAARALDDIAGPRTPEGGVR
jgi:hypothetical protein